MVLLLLVLLLLVHLLILLPLLPHPIMHPSVPFTRPTRVPLWRALKSFRNNMSLFAEVAQSSSPNHPEVVSLDNPIEVDPSLILMTANEPNTSNIPLFTHNCQIKHELATLIMDNGSQKNLVSQDLVQRLQLPTTTHSNPYQLSGV